MGQNWRKNSQIRRKNDNIKHMLVECLLTVFRRCAKIDYSVTNYAHFDIDIRIHGLV